MSAHESRQYRPISTLETAADDSMSVRAINELADSINNYCRYSGNHKIISEMCIPVWQSLDTTNTDESVIALFAPRLVPDGFTNFTWTIGHYLTEVGTDCTWRLYCNEWLYYGEEAFDASFLSPNYSVATIVSDSAVHEIDVDRSLEVVRGVHGWCWLVLTAQNNADALSRGALTSIDVVPIIS